MQILPIMISILLLSSLLEAFFFLPLHAKDILKVTPSEKKSHKIWEFNYNLYGNILSYGCRLLFVYKYNHSSRLGGGQSQSKNRSTADKRDVPSHPFVYRGGSRSVPGHESSAS